MGSRLLILCVTFILFPRQINAATDNFAGAHPGVVVIEPFADYNRYSLNASLAKSGVNSPSKNPDLPALVNWISTWIQGSGAIHGFHNHAVWGSNPYRFADFTSGHTTFASFVILILARLDKLGVKGSRALFNRTLNFQLGSRQTNGQFDHIGFQVGETLKKGLIHNMVPCVALLLTLQELDPKRREFLGPQILTVVRGVLSTTSALYGARAGAASVCNQEYARQWVHLLLADAHKKSDPASSTRIAADALADLSWLANNLLVRGAPDADSMACLRVPSSRDLLEPAEYYGLMMPPLLLAYRRTKNAGWLRQAIALARHVVRSSWVDGAGARRFHRLYQFVGGRFVRISSPMLIAGMGLTLEGARLCATAAAAQAAAAADPAGGGGGLSPKEWAAAAAELRGFVRQAQASMARYQHPRGFFLAASGWFSEVDLAPSTAWHSHDAWHLLASRGTAAAAAAALRASVRLSDAVAAAADGEVSVVLGESCYYAESGVHWWIGDYKTEDVFELLGRKDRATFGRDLSWIGGSRALPPEFTPPHPILVMRADNRLQLLSPPPPGGLRYLSVSPLPLVGWPTKAGVRTAGSSSESGPTPSQESSPEAQSRKQAASVRVPTVWLGGVAALAAAGLLLGLLSRRVGSI